MTSHTRREPALDVSLLKNDLRAALRQSSRDDDFADRRSCLDELMGGSHRRRRESVPSGLQPSIVAHLMFYVEQPNALGGTELTVIYRLVTPLSRAKAILDAAGLRLSQSASRGQSRRMRETDGQIEH